MNSIINFSLKNKFALWLITIIVVVSGLYSGTQMKMETLPDITTPVVTVTTVYPGAAPQEVADEVTKPIEQRIQNLQGVETVDSSSFQNASAITIMYDFDTDMEKAEAEVKSIMAELSLPEGVQSPKVSRMSFSAFPVITLSAANDKQSLAELTKQVEEEIVPKLEGVDGVASIQVSGQQVDEVQLTFKGDQMKKYGLQEDTVRGLLQASNVRFPLGLYQFGEKEQSVVVDGKLTTLEELRNLEIPYNPAAMGGVGAGTGGQQPATPGAGMGAMPGAAGQPNAGAGAGAQTLPPTAQGQATANIKMPTVKLSEVADIKLTGQAESVSRTNGQDAIGMQIVKAADANTVEVVNAVKAVVADFEAKYPDLEFISTSDQGKPIEDSVNTMLSKALFGAGFAMLIILLFLRNLRTTLISVVSIPLSLLIAVLLLHQMDITLNIMTLGAMTVAIGRVVDDSIVVVENIYRRMSLKQEKLKGFDLIREATKEMFMPILSSTIVTIAVFLPLGLVSGMVGEMFLPFGLTIVFALLASLLVAITIVPMMAHQMFKHGISDKHQHHEDNPGRLALAYKRTLQWSLNHKVITSLIAVALLVGSLMLTPFVGVSFLPSEEQKMVIATFNPEAGQTLEDVKKTATMAEEYFQGNEHVDVVQYSIGSENPMSPGARNQALFFISYNPDTPNFTELKENVIPDLQEKTPKGEWGQMDFATGGFSGSDMKMYVFGDNMEKMKPVVEDLEKRMSTVEGLKDVESSLSDAYEEYTLAIDHKKLSQYGLTSAQVGMELSQQRERPVLTTVEKDGEELNVYLQVKEKKANSVDDLLNRELTTPLGTKVKVKDVVELNEGTTSDTVTSKNGRLVLDVSGKITGSNVAEVSAAVQKEIDAMKLPVGVEISTGGVTADIEESFKQLGIAMIAAIAIVYLVLVITFGGGLAPFAILFSLPFTIIGAIVALFIAGETISVSALIGMLMLIGIVVTNAIVLIDRVIQKEEEGYSVRESLLEAATTRLRPILMTAIATIGALIPLAIGMEGSGVISRGLGVTVIGGLTSSTLLTLLIVPIVYEAVSKISRKGTKKKANAA
ncbi:efflux RND transporter permease subunit [Paenibacillus sp. SC116]|uniref:efflux RND transporter permease subunit n=1 Tax=Paenibacillus sp. SC116 TaxID=2968986 RepID=UPI00215B3B8B|nr:efflux RND transporter permease subunit [Paenibacillus sp. SC116]MCR8844617.1 efflux RND transporter permease subunit [Paenibacillus sp. SC116]